MSNLIELRNPKITKPTARDACASKPNKASLGNFVFFCNCKRMIAKDADIKKTAKAILISKKTAIVTPSSAECAKVPAKKENLLQMIKHPHGPVTKAIPIPATKALIKKSFNIAIVYD